MRTRSILVITVILSVFTTQLHANVTITKGVREIIEAISKKGSKKAVQELAEFGGKEAIQATLEKAAREGGEELVEKVVKYGRRYGVSAVRVIDNAPVHYIKALDGLPEKLIERAMWAVQREPEVMTKLVRDYGTDALLIATKHRGIGGDLVRKLGSEGVRLGKALPESQAVVVARHADEIAALPQSQQSRVIEAILAAPARTLDYLEKHPKILFTAAGVGTVIALKDEILGEDKEVKTTPDGTSIVRRRGFAERTLEQFRKPIVLILSIIAGILALWGLTKIWGVYRLEKLRIANKGLELQQKRNAASSAKELDAEQVGPVDG
jgi:hypothetical protein